MLAHDAPEFLFLRDVVAPKRLGRGTGFGFGLLVQAVVALGNDGEGQEDQAQKNREPHHGPAEIMASNIVVNINQGIQERLIKGREPEIAEHI